MEEDREDHYLGGMGLNVRVANMKKDNKHFPSHITNLLSLQ